MPSNRALLIGQSREESCTIATKIVMAVCGLSHTYNTKVGNDFIRGVSGGERKRVSIAEMILAQSPLAAWDNRLVKLSKWFTFTDILQHTWFGFGNSFEVCSDHPSGCRLHRRRPRHGHLPS